MSAQTQHTLTYTLFHYFGTTERGTICPSVKVGADGVVLSSALTSALGGEDSWQGSGEEQWGMDQQHMQQNAEIQ